MAADAVRRKLHPEGVVTYIIDRNINYTNFCTEYCSFCASTVRWATRKATSCRRKSIFEKIQETIDLGGTGILMQGGLHPDLKIEWYEDLFRAIKKRFPIHLHCFSAPEVTNIAEVSGLSLRDTIARLRDCRPRFDSRRRRRDSRRRGAPSDQPAEVLDAGMDRRAPHRAFARHAHHGDDDVRLRRDDRAADESFRDRARGSQEDTGGFTAFIPWTFQRENTSLGRFVKEEATAVEYLQDAGDFAALSGEHSERAIVLGDAGPEDLPARTALRRQ